jgi:molybdopterin-guanine dinucleotide biosynthesis protein A
MNGMRGVVLAGGASSRFGGAPKGLARIAGRAMALRVADVLSKICQRVAIEAPRGAGYDRLGLPLVHAAPEHAGKGPLAALAAGLGEGSSAHTVAFAPCDMPLLTRDVYAALSRANGVGAYACSPDGFEPLVAVLSIDVLPALLSALSRDALPRTHVVLDQAGVQRCEFTDAAPFANVNTPEDRARIEALLSSAAKSNGETG